MVSWPVSTRDNKPENDNATILDRLEALLDQPTSYPIAPATPCISAPSPPFLRYSTNGTCAARTKSDFCVVL
jgi:hypothetical protein